MHRRLLIVAALGAASFARADFTLTYTATNDLSGPSGNLYLRAPVNMTSASVTANAPFCLPPRFEFSSSSGQTYVRVFWPCACVRPGDSVTVAVQADAEVPLELSRWGTGIGTTCPGVLPSGFRVADVDGDLDGFPDTSETFDLDLDLRNYGEDRTNVVAYLSTDDPKLDCVIASTVAVGSIPSGATVALPSPFRLHVHPAADRGEPCPRPRAAEESARTARGRARSLPIARSWRSTTIRAW